MSEGVLKRIEFEEVGLCHKSAVDDHCLRQASKIVEDVRINGDAALWRWSIELGDIKATKPLVLKPSALEASFRELPLDDQKLLERVSLRIRKFAQAQLQCAKDLTVSVDGGMAGHNWMPLDSAGCYAPGGRFPLPSSVLMTAVTAREAGVKKVWVCSPRPSKYTLAAAFVAKADAFLCVGGAQAIAALAYGTKSVECCDVIVGPGNRWVTAAKQIVSATARIDMLAGPTELVIVADGSADASLVAANLLAQAEHDQDALPILISLDEKLIASVNGELLKQLAMLRTAKTASVALSRGYALLAKNLEQAAEISNKLAPEHLQLAIRDAMECASFFKQYGAVFIGQSTPEVLGDYGAGPNHVLPTGGMARTSGGLSVFNFLCLRTWLRIDNGREAEVLATDAERLASIEGLHAHEKAAIYCKRHGLSS